MPGVPAPWLCSPRGGAGAQAPAAASAPAPGEGCGGRCRAPASCVAACYLANKVLQDNPLGWARDPSPLTLGGFNHHISPSCFSQTQPENVPGTPAGLQRGCWRGGRVRPTGGQRSCHEQPCRGRALERAHTTMCQRGRSSRRDGAGIFSSSCSREGGRWGARWPPALAASTPGSRSTHSRSGARRS